MEISFKLQEANTAFQRAAQKFSMKRDPLHSHKNSRDYSSSNTLPSSSEPYEPSVQSIIRKSIRGEDECCVEDEEADWDTMQNGNADFSPGNLSNHSEDFDQSQGMTQFEDAPTGQAEMEDDRERDSSFPEPATLLGDGEALPNSVAPQHLDDSDGSESRDTLQQDDNSLDVDEPSNEESDPENENKKHSSSNLSLVPYSSESQDSELDEKSQSSSVLSVTENSKYVTPSPGCLAKISSKDQTKKILIMQRGCLFPYFKGRGDTTSNEEAVNSASTLLSQEEVPGKGKADDSGDHDSNTSDREVHSLKSESEHKPSTEDDTAERVELEPVSKESKESKTSDAVTGSQGSEKLIEDEKSQTGSIRGKKSSSSSTRSSPGCQKTDGSCSAEISKRRSWKTHRNGSKSSSSSVEEEGKKPVKGRIKLNRGVCSGLDSSKKRINDATEVSNTSKSQVHKQEESHSNGVNAVSKGTPLRQNEPDVPPSKLLTIFSSSNDNSPDKPPAYIIPAKRKLSLKSETSKPKIANEVTNRSPSDLQDDRSQETPLQIERASPSSNSHDELLDKFTPQFFKKIFNSSNSSSPSCASSDHVANKTSEKAATQTEAATLDLSTNKKSTFHHDSEYDNLAMKSISSCCNSMQLFQDLEMSATVSEISEKNVHEIGDCSTFRVTLNDSRKITYAQAAVKNISPTCRVSPNVNESKANSKRRFSRWGSAFNVKPKPPQSGNTDVADGPISCVNKNSNKRLSTDSVNMTSPKQFETERNIASSYVSPCTNEASSGAVRSLNEIDLPPSTIIGPQYTPEQLGLHLQHQAAVTSSESPFMNDVFIDVSRPPPSITASSTPKRPFDEVQPAATHSRGRGKMLRSSWSGSSLKPGEDTTQNFKGAWSRNWSSNNWTPNSQSPPSKNSLKFDNGAPWSGSSSATGPECNFELPLDSWRRSWDFTPPGINRPSFNTFLSYEYTPPTSDSSDNKCESVVRDWKQDFRDCYFGYQTPFIDTHCHIDYLLNRSSYRGSFTRYRLENADIWPPNYQSCVAIFCNPKTWRATYGVRFKETMKEEGVFGAVGCHPKCATDFHEEQMQMLQEMLCHPKIRALGEIGLDYSYNFKEKRSVQISVFRKQMELAKVKNLPLVIHCRDAEQDCIEQLQQVMPKNYLIHRHCFTGTWEEAETWLRLFPNSLIGLTPLVTYRMSYGPRTVAQNIPLKRLLLETDAPYFVPQGIPKQGMKYSHPGMALTVAAEVAKLKNMNVEHVLSQCLINSKNFYNLP